MIKRTSLASLVLFVLFAFAFNMTAIANTPAADQRTATLATLDVNGGNDANIIVLGYSQSAYVYNDSSAVISATFAVTTPAAKTFTCVAATDLCTAATAGFLNGLKGQGTTVTTLPAGLSLTTDYFVIFVSTTTFKLATTHALALAGTAIDITDAGTGAHTFTPTALAGGAVSLQGSIDGTNWFDIASTSQNVTAAATLAFTITTTSYPFARLKFINTAGVLTSTTKYSGKSA